MLASYCPSSANCQPLAEKLYLPMIALWAVEFSPVVLIQIEAVTGGPPGVDELKVTPFEAETPLKSSEPPAMPVEDREMPGAPPFEFAGAPRLSF